eukprot:scaffold38052_cov68-Cyclotella_meneghiniana.AAC.6
MGPLPLLHGCNQFAVEGGMKMPSTVSTSILLLVCATTSNSIQLTSAFTAPAKNQVRTYDSNAILVRHRSHNCGSSTQLYNLFDDDDNEDDDLDKYDYKTAAQIRKARKLLKDAKKKIEAELDDKINGATLNGSSKGKESSTPLPFFASRNTSSTTQKIKSTTSSGIVADGATMTDLSNSEPWESRPLNTIFVNEPRSDYDGNIVMDDYAGERKSTLAERDLARNILALRRQLQDEDFQKVFNSRNRWIGDVE